MSGRTDGPPRVIVGARPTAARSDTPYGCRPGRGDQIIITDTIGPGSQNNPIGRPFTFK
jgi:hypothetical protein